MLRELLKPQNGVKLLTGLSGLFFERLLAAVPANGHAAVPVAESAPVVVQETAVVPTPPAETIDDLTLINGIGPTFARRLQEAGITTFGRLAELTPEVVKELARLSDWQADPAGWIAQARARTA